MKRKKNIIDEISFLMMDAGNLGSDTFILERLNDIPNIDLRGRDGRTLLIHACAYNKKAIVQHLIDKSADLNLQDDMGYSALHACVISNNFDCAKLLLQSGANINLCDNIGNIPLFYVSKGAYDMLHLLLAHGANYEAKNFYDVSPIDTFQADSVAIQIFDKYRRGN